MVLKATDNGNRGTGKRSLVMGTTDGTSNGVVVGWVACRSKQV